ncbi:four helix bundle protein [Nostoc sp. JL33]|uniref:four helix bundle protein n=1 Tax=Nostoc sp. JL33 TaxID=2815396 RepID=UPI0025E4D3F1|nr:four helix bundle protein [Nostoc sp. JL33]MBN3870552.1 four helix bundle protein [Nostoc sp. JL33]
MRQPAKTFQDLIVWQKAHLFVLLVYQFTSQFSKLEIYGLTSQFRRAAISIPAIAVRGASRREGFQKKGTADKARFMNISQGSLEECRYYLIFSNHLGYGDTSELMLKLEEVSKLLTSYANSILNPDS